MRGKPGHNTRPHAWLPPSFLGMDARITSTWQLNVALIRKLRGSLIYFAYVFTCYQWVFYNQVLTDAQLTGAEIKCLYCNSFFLAHLKKRYRAVAYHVRAPEYGGSPNALLY